MISIFFIGIYQMVPFQIPPRRSAADILSMEGRLRSFCSSRPGMNAAEPTTASGGNDRKRPSLGWRITCHSRPILWSPLVACHQEIWQPLHAALAVDAGQRALGLG